MPARTTHVETPSELSTTKLLYTLLLIATFLVGYLLAKVQAADQGLLGGGTPQPQGTAQGAAQNPGGAQAPVKANVATGHLPVLGNKNAKVKIIEFSDFQCPFCRKFYEDAYLQLKKEYIDTGKVAFYYRHFPLSFHAMAEPSALAAECANEQGKFWEYHDKMYEEQAKQGQGTIQYTNDDLKTWAAALGMDATKFNSCFDSAKFKNNVTKDQSDGSAAGVSGTPSFYVNGTQLVGAQPFTAFKTAIDAALK